MYSHDSVHYTVKNAQSLSRLPARLSLTILFLLFPHKDWSFPVNSLSQPGILTESVWIGLCSCSQVGVFLQLFLDFAFRGKFLDRKRKNGLCKQISSWAMGFFPASGRNGSNYVQELVKQISLMSNGFFQRQEEIVQELCPGIRLKFLQCML